MLTNNIYYLDWNRLQIRMLAAHKYEVLQKAGDAVGNTQT